MYTMLNDGGKVAARMSLVSFFWKLCHLIEIERVYDTRVSGQPRSEIALYNAHLHGLRMHMALHRALHCAYNSSTRRTCIFYTERARRSLIYTLNIHVTRMQHACVS